MLSNIPYEEMPEKIEELAGDIERLENNWNELKEFLKEELSKSDRYEELYILGIDDCIKKLQDIESRKSAEKCEKSAEKV